MMRRHLTTQMTLSPALSEIVEALRHDFSDATESWLEAKARQCQDAIGYYASPGEDFPEGDIAICMGIVGGGDE